MDFKFTPDQTALLKMVQEVVAKEIVPYTHEMDENAAMRPTSTCCRGGCQSSVGPIHDAVKTV